MNELLVTMRPRRVIPRWRNFATTALLGELSLPLSRRTSAAIASDLEGASLRFERMPSVSSAGELLICSVINGVDNMARLAAGFILESKVPVLGLLKAVAANVMTQSAVSPANLDQVDLLPHDLSGVGIKRRRTRLFSSDAIAWIELGLAFISIGKKESALRAVKSALQLAPNNRFVIRSTIRCLLHCHQHEAAHEILSRHPNTRRDPWLLASQLAVAEITSKSSHLVKDARQILSSKAFAPLDLAELSASLATTELFAGNDKRSRRLFQQSLTDVTENVLAQVIWAKNHLRMDMELSSLSPPRNFEAEARSRIRENDWVGGLAATRKWGNDEPFSGRPAELGSFIASVVEEDFPLAEQIAQHGLIANAEHGMLLNNLAFSQACQGKLTEAKATISKVALGSLDIPSRVAVLATKGLILFREGDIEGGRAGYKAAMALADEHKAPSVKIMAMIFQAREEWRARTATAVEAVSSAQEAAAHEKLVTVRIAADRLLKYVSKPDRRSEDPVVKAN